MAEGRVLRVDPRDDVVVALAPLDAGTTVADAGASLRVREAIPVGHKLAVRDLAAGAVVHKFGAPIGRATQPILAGAHVHVHNLATMLEEGATPVFAGAPARPSIVDRPDAWHGYRRADGRAATRNELWIIPTVGCVNALATRLATLARTRLAGRADGVHAFPHPFGCSQLGDDLARTRHVLAGLAMNPNAGGVLLLGLGCENNRLDALRAELATVPAERLASFDAQGVSDEEESGLAAIERLLDVMAHDVRVPLPLSALVLGTKCGGSDGFSGLTANPLVGAVAERVTAAGGVALLSEVPEMFGAEASLLARAVSPRVHADVVRLVDDFKRYFRAHAQPIHENPSPGNKDGGITTLEEKSLGATQKGGRAPVTQVVAYGDAVRTDADVRGGLALVEAPGNDAVSTTALTAAGATLILFTTGRGTPLGAPVPTLKVASTSDLATRKPRWIDFDAGPILAGAPLDDTAEALLALACRIASGAPARHEESDVREIAVWKQGVTL